MVCQAGSREATQSFRSCIKLLAENNFQTLPTSPVPNNVPVPTSPAPDRPELQPTPPNPVLTMPIKRPKAKASDLIGPGEADLRHPHHRSRQEEQRLSESHRPSIPTYSPGGHPPLAMRWRGALGHDGLIATLQQIHRKDLPAVNRRVFTWSVDGSGATGRGREPLG